jgi:hypothetical protein
MRPVYGDAAGRVTRREGRRLRSRRCARAEDDGDGDPNVVIGEYRRREVD